MSGAASNFPSYFPGPRSPVPSENLSPRVMAQPYTAKGSPAFAPIEGPKGQASS